MIARRAPASCSRCKQTGMTFSPSRALRPRPISCTPCSKPSMNTMAFSAASAHRPFASAPYVVGKGAPAPVEQHIPAEESLCPVISHKWVNSEYKHLIVDASPKALAVKPGQFFNLLCPSPDAGELWLRRPQSVYRIDRARGRIEFLYKCVGRGTYGLATLKHGDDLNMVGPLGVGFSVDPGWKHIVVLGRGVGLATLAPISQLAREYGIGVSAILSARSAEFVMADDL